MNIGENRLDDGRGHLAESVKGSVNLSFDLVQGYGKGQEGEIVDFCIEAIRSVSIVSESIPKEFNASKSRFLKNYSEMSKSGIAVSPASIVGAFHQALNSDMRGTLLDLLNDKNRQFVEEGVSAIKGQKQELPVRKHHSTGPGPSM